MEWLSITNTHAPTMQVAESTVASELATTYSGWTIASSSQVVTLFDDFGLPSTINQPVSSSSTSVQQNIRTLVDDFGPYTATFGPFIAGTNSDGGVGVADVGANLSGIISGNYEVSSGPGYENFVNPGYGVFLVQQIVPVPVPASAVLMLSGVLALGTMVRRRRATV